MIFNVPRQNNERVTQFATTADVRAVSDSSIPTYIGRYALTFGIAIAFDVVVRTIWTDVFAPIGMASMASYICTAPATKPRFRSLPRYAIALMLSAIFAFMAANAYKMAGVDEIVTSAWVVTGVFYTVIFGCMESLAFLWTCLLTPGRDPERK
ncbi:hypothetical protein Pla52o_58170 [Novipirellula galeiformis]|uniref:Uncharacterized protein n=1 Tax=Novipirellula galeiformis TaxID=2528004 RepID=A0A5C6BCX8_9BACT|nr:hypothetical protein Pla52o_58170 [Novipirellula galeiformis]